VHPLMIEPTGWKTCPTFKTVLRLNVAGIKKEGGFSNPPINYGGRDRPPSLFFL